MKEPEQHDKYYIRIEQTTIDGERGKAKIKVWIDEEGKHHEKVISFDRER